MSRHCPECGHPTPADVAPGRAYACPKCANPVLATEHPRAPVAGAGPAPGALSRPDVQPSRSHWKMALVAFVVLGAAYVGAYELLTAEAQRDRGKLLKLFGDRVSTFPKPEAPSAGDAKALNAYEVARLHYQARGEFEACESRIAAGRLGMGVAFGAQTLFAVWVYLKSRRGRARAEAATARAAGRT